MAEVGVELGQRVHDVDLEVGGGEEIVKEREAGRRFCQRGINCALGLGNVGEGHDEGREVVVDVQEVVEERREEPGRVVDGEDEAADGAQVFSVHEAVDGIVRFVEQAGRENGIPGGRGRGRGSAAATAGGASCRDGRSVRRRHRIVVAVVVVDTVIVVSVGENGRQIRDGEDFGETWSICCLTWSGKGISLSAA